MFSKPSLKTKAQCNQIPERNPKRFKQQSSPVKSIEEEKIETYFHETTTQTTQSQLDPDTIDVVCSDNQSEMAITRNTYCEIIKCSQFNTNHEKFEISNVDCSTKLHHRENNIVESDPLDEIIGYFEKIEGSVQQGGCIPPEEIIKLYKITTVMRDLKKFMVGILDTGIDYEKIKGYTHIKWKFFPSQQEVHDEHGHGTAIASTIAEFLREFVKQGGKVTICVFKISHIDRGLHSIKAATAIDKLRLAYERGCTVINLSFIFHDISLNLQNLLKKELINCEDKATIFMASGNIPDNYPCTKACIPAFWANNGLKKSNCVSVVNQKGVLTISRCNGKGGNCIIAPGHLFVQDSEWIGTSFATCVATAVYIMNGKTDNFLLPPSNQPE